MSAGTFPNCDCETLLHSLEKQSSTIDGFHTGLIFTLIRTQISCRPTKPIILAIHALNLVYHML